jgi:amino acid/peptide:H+ symporter
MAQAESKIQTSETPRSGGFLSLFLDHPKGLYSLFFTEMWERFSFYLMLALLSLYMTDYLDFPDAKASEIATWYISLVYFTPFLGGLIADKMANGYVRAILIGGALMMAGHIVLAFDAKTSEMHPALFAALALLILGNGMFKPNISTMVGSLYSENDPRRDSGFTIFYMGINVGAFIAPIAANFLRTNAVTILNGVGMNLHEGAGWHIAFGSAGVGMLLSLIIFYNNKQTFEDKTIQSKFASVNGQESPGDSYLAIVQWFNMGAVILALIGLLFGGFSKLVPLIQAVVPARDRRHSLRRRLAGD